LSLQSKTALLKADSGVRKSQIGLKAGSLEQTNAIWRFPMSALSMTPQRQGVTTPSSRYGLFAALERWWVAFLTWQLERAAIIQLANLSDRELKDIGLHRSQIPAAVHDGTTSLRMSLHHY
jgi:uncharacterized protein YjiS (DUF1127 family)